MSAKARPWLIGCGIGCGLVLILLGVVAVGGAFLVRDVVQRVEEIESAGDALETRFGSTADYHPAADGQIDPLRIEAFLDARALMAPVRAELEEDLARLAAAEEKGMAGSGESLLGLLSSGAGLLPGIFDFATARSQAMLDAGIGPGEYLYLYTLSYYVFLGRSAGDGPTFPLVSGADDHRGHGDPFLVREERLVAIRRRLNQRLLPILRNQLADARAAGAAGDWRERLAREVEAMENSPRRLPWQDGLPPFMAEALEPFRDRLAASYSELCNPLETGTGP